ncbi:MAG: hypothetical protein QXL96_07615 [Ignisphaera sp.]
MESRYILAGLTIIALAASFLVYGLVVVSDRVVGIALSVAVVGVVLAFVGIGYSEPAENMLSRYAEDLNMFLTRIVEDMGIPNNHKLKLCYTQKILCLSENDVTCGDVVTGISIAGNTPYVGIPTENILNFLSNISAGEDIIDKFKRVFIEIAAVCRGIAIAKQDDLISVEFTNLTDKGFNYIKTPINLLRLYTLALIAHHYERDVEIVEESVSQEGYRVKLRIESATHG